MILVHMHQPHFLPSIQYFSRIARSDIFLFADNVQHRRAWWEHRNRILFQGKPSMLTVKVSQADPFSRIDQTPIFRPRATFRKITATLQHAYRRAPGWHLIEALCEQISARAAEWSSLAACNLELIEWLANTLGLTTPLHRWSDHPLERDIEDDNHWRSERIARYAEKFGCTHFLFGRGTASYLDTKRFSCRGITLVADQWAPRPYPQPGNTFLPNLSIVDLLAQRPGDAADYLGTSA